MSTLPNINCLSFEERARVYSNAMMAISPTEQDSINAMVEELITKIKIRNPAITFSRENALELIAALGIGIISGKFRIIVIQEMVDA